MCSTWLADAQAHGSLPCGQQEVPEGNGTIRSLRHHTEDGWEDEGWLGAQGPFRAP